MTKKKQISDYKHLKQVPVVLYKEDQAKIERIQKEFDRRKCLGKLTVASILRYALEQLDEKALFESDRPIGRG